MATLQGIGRLEQPTYRFPAHQHRFWELVLYTHGEGTAVVGDRTYRFSPGTIICMPPFLPHAEHSHGGYRNIFIHTPGYPPGEGRVPVTHDSPEASFRRAAELLLNEYTQRLAGWKPIADQLFGVLLGYLARWDVQGNEPADVRALREGIEHGYHDAGFSLSRLSRTLPCHPDHLRRRFAEHHGRTPHAYLTELRMRRARDLLRLRGMSVKRCAAAVGYHDPLYFSRAFRKHFGMAPTHASVLG